VLEHIAAHTAASRAKMVHAKPPLADAAEGERASAAPAAESEAHPVELSATERARVQKALDDLQMPPREQACYLVIAP
tara:strand:- start:427 stop:660 length:234 start_codon:yes stop_codon:yes gene_type:complete